MAIVIPAYKGRFLKETLDSIAVQAHKDEFVLYIGDDASPERLDKIVESYQNKVNLVYHRFSENMGGKDLVAHWERCIQLSAEPFICKHSASCVFFSPLFLPTFVASL